METKDTYTVTVDGVSYAVEILCTDESWAQWSRQRLGAIVEPAGQAPWVTLHHTTHLPSR